VEQSEIELEYERRWKAMSPAEKVARSSAMLAWTRQQMAIRIRNTQPSLSDEEVRLYVALQLYEQVDRALRCNFLVRPSWGMLKSCRNAMSLSQY
jgi:uncharacterized Fe-S cluster-containing radical SAM superfamily protein